MTEALALYTKISQVGFAGLFFLVIVGGYYQIWTWGRDLRKAEERAKFWQDLYLSRVTVAETEAAALRKMVEHLTGTA